MATHSIQYSRLENSLHRGAWWALLHGVTKRLDRAAGRTHTHTHTHTHRHIHIYKYISYWDSLNKQITQVLYDLLLKYGPWTSSTGITWELEMKTLRPRPISTKSKSAL